MLNNYPHPETQCAIVCRMKKVKRKKNDNKMEMELY